MRPRANAGPDRRLSCLSGGEGDGNACYAPVMGAWKGSHTVGAVQSLNCELLEIPAAGGQ